MVVVVLLLLLVLLKMLHLRNGAHWVFFHDLRHDPVFVDVTLI